MVATRRLCARDNGYLNLSQAIEPHISLEKREALALENQYAEQEDCTESRGHTRNDLTDFLEGGACGAYAQARSFNGSGARAVVTAPFESCGRGYNYMGRGVYR